MTTETLTIPASHFGANSNRAALDASDALDRAIEQARQARDAYKAGGNEEKAAEWNNRVDALIRAYNAI